MLTIIVKGTNGCNLACSYCSLGEKKNFEFVDEKRLKEVLRYGCEYALSQNQGNITFILHGGEPTLVGTEVYEDSIDFIRNKYPQLNIIISMQSNGLMVTDKFIEFAIKYYVHMGISIDGSAEIHDLERRTSGNDATYYRITENIDRLLNSGVNVSCLMVLTKNAIGKGYEYLRYFEKRKLHLKINPLLNYGEVYVHPELMLETGEYAKYLIDLYEYVISKDIAITISPSDNILKAIIFRQRIGECSFNKECNKHFLCIDYKGDIYPCGKFSDMDKFKLGNIYDITYEKLAEKINKGLYERRNRCLPKGCAQCSYLKLCNGGCSAEAVIDGNFNEKPILCEDYRTLFEYFSREGLILLKDDLLRQKRVLEEKKCEI